MVKQWKDDWMHFGAEPRYVALSRLFVNDELEVLIQFHGTPQKHFYTVTRFDNGVRSDVAGELSSLDDAKTAA